MAAQYSMPYIVGATLAYGPTRFDAYGDDHHNDDRILELIDRVEARHESSFDALVPAKMPNRVDLHLHDGSTRSAEVLDSRGTPVHPLSTAGVLETARALCETVDPNIDLAAIVADCDNVAELTDLLVVPSFEDSLRQFKETHDVDRASAR